MMENDQYLKGTTLYGQVQQWLFVCSSMLNPLRPAESEAFRTFWLWNVHRDSETLDVPWRQLCDFQGKEFPRNSCGGKENIFSFILGDK